MNKNLEGHWPKKIEVLEMKVKTKQKYILFLLFVGF